MRWCWCSHHVGIICINFFVILRFKFRPIQFTTKLANGVRWEPLRNCYDFMSKLIIVCHSGILSIIIIIIMNGVHRASTFWMSFSPPLFLCCLSLNFCIFHSLSLCLSISPFIFLYFFPPIALCHSAIYSTSRNTFSVQIVCASSNDYVCTVGTRARVFRKRINPSLLSDKHLHKFFKWFHATHAPHPNIVEWFSVEGFILFWFAYSK